MIDISIITSIDYFNDDYGAEYLLSSAYGIGYDSGFNYSDIVSRNKKISREFYHYFNLNFIKRFLNGYINKLISLLVDYFNDGIGSGDGSGHGYD